MQVCFMLVALNGGILAANIPEKPLWARDYSEGRSLTLRSGKPMAVFLDRGQMGWERGKSDGSDARINQLLKEKYVCVFIDTNTEAGKRLAADFSVSGSGLIISDKEGKSQQFHHSGELGRGDLVKVLERYSQANRVFVSTETLAQVSPPPVSAPPVSYQYQPTIRLSGG